MAVRVVGLYVRLDPSVFRSAPTRAEKQKRPCQQLLSLFAFRKLIDGPFSTIYRKHAMRIHVFDAEPIFLFLSVFLNHQSPVTRLTRRSNPNLLELLRKEYNLHAIRLRFSRYIAL